MKHTWRIPALIAALTLAGLVGGLVADGMGDVLAWISLALPALIGARLLAHRSAAPARRRERT
jgi:hypothetical protein